MAGEDEETKAERKMRHIVEEMMETEAAYVQSLRDVEDRFLIPCMHFRKPIGPLEALDVEVVFANIQSLREIHENFLGALNSAMTAPSWTGAIFLDNVETFKTHYVEYCANTNASIETLTAWFNDPKIAEFLAKCAKDANKPLGLGPELLKPVQRILKYPLLLKELLKVCDKDDEGYDNALEAVKKLNEVAEEINDRKRAAENMEKVLNLERRLDGHKGSLLDYGLLVKCGSFRVQESRKSRSADRWLFLFEKGLLIAREDSQPNFGRNKEDSKLHFKNLIELSALAVTLGKGAGPDKCYFEVNGTYQDKTNTYTVYCPNDELRQEWVGKMNELRNASLVAFLKAKADNQKFDDLDGTVGLNREKMRLREERLVQLRNRKKGEKIPPVPAKVQTLFRQTQRMPVQRQSTISSTGSEGLNRSASNVDVRNMPSVTSEADVGRNSTQSPTEDGDIPKLVVRTRKPPPSSPRISRPPSSPPPTSPQLPPPRRMSGVPTTPDRGPPPEVGQRVRSMSSAASHGPPPALPPRIPTRSGSVATINTNRNSGGSQEFAKEDSILEEQRKPVPAPPHVIGSSQEDTVNKPTLKLVRPPGPALRGPPPFMPRSPAAPPRMPAPRPPQIRAPAPPQVPVEHQRKSPPPVAPKPPAPPNLGQHH